MDLSRNAVEAVPYADRGFSKLLLKWLSIFEIKTFVILISLHKLIFFKKDLMAAT